MKAQVWAKILFLNRRWKNIYPEQLNEQLNEFLLKSSGYENR